MRLHALLANCGGILASRRAKTLDTMSAQYGGGGGGCDDLLASESFVGLRDGGFRPWVVAGLVSDLAGDDATAPCSPDARASGSSSSTP